MRVAIKISWLCAVMMGDNRKLFPNTSLHRRIKTHHNKGIFNCQQHKDR